MKVLVACEESQRVCSAFRELGHEAYSCDILPCSGGHPEWHIQGDVLPLLDGRCSFLCVDGGLHTLEGRWDLIIAHPPCTYLTVSGNSWFDTEKHGKKAEQRWRERVDGAVFFMRFLAADCDHIAVENPIGCMNTAYRPPDCIIQPYQFGDHARKTTCLWLKGLPPLMPTAITHPGEILPSGYSVNAHADAARDENGKIISWNDPRTAIARSKTFPGIARAMAEQWGGDIRKENNEKRGR